MNLSSAKMFKQALALMIDHIGKVLFLIFGQIAVLVLAQTVVLPVLPETSESLLVTDFLPTIALGLMIFLYNAFFALILIRLFRSEKGQEELSVFTGAFWKKFCLLTALTILLFVVLGLASAFFVIPGIVLGCYLVFSAYFLVTENVSIIASLKQSYAAVKGNWWYVFRRMLFLLNFALLLSLIRLVPGPGARTFAWLSFFFSPAVILYLGVLFTEFQDMMRKPQLMSAMHQSTGTKVLLVMWAILGFLLLTFFTAMGDFVVQVYAMYTPDQTLPIISVFGF